MRVPGKGNTEQKSNKQQMIMKRKRLNLEKVVEKDSKDAETRNCVKKGALSQLRINMFQQIKVHFNPSIRNIDLQNKLYEVIQFHQQGSGKWS